MTPEQARDLKTQLDGISKQTQLLTDGMDASGLLKRPANAGWSVAENLQHLILTAEAMLPLAEVAIRQLEREARKTDRSSGLGFIGWLLIKALERPGRMKSKTAAPFEPVSVGDPLTLVAKLQVRNDQLDALIARASGLATSTVKVISPFNPSMKYNLYAAFCILLCHARRHLWQAEQVKAGR